MSELTAPRRIHRAGDGPSPAPPETPESALDAGVPGITGAADSNIIDLSLPAALIPDRALLSAADDALGHDAVATVIASLVMSVESPSNVALFGPWGSGKSSLYGMVKEKVEPRRVPGKRWGWEQVSGVRMVRYDAWKFAGQSLQRNFLSVLATELDLSQRLLDRLDGARETSRLRLGRYVWRNKSSLLLALVIGIVLGAAWTLLAGWAAHRWGIGVEAPVEFDAAVSRALPSGAVVAGAVWAALLLGNQAMASAVEKRSQSPLQDADQFSAAFDAMMQVVTRRRWRARLRVKRLVVFIDELDRCRSHEVVSTLSDLMTFLGHRDCVFVVAADREVLEEALEKAPQVKPLREDEPYYSTAGAFLDKVFQHQLPLPPTRTEALTVYARDLANRHQGLWSTLRQLDKSAFEDVVYSLVPTHVRSPRRVKVLMNNYVTAAHLLHERGLRWTDRPTQIAVLTVLQTEFPSVVRDFLRQPRLLDGLLGLHDDMSPELTAMVQKYDPGSSQSQASPTPLLSEAQVEDARKERARRRLNEQLAAYLGKVHAAAIPLPTPELVYAQRAAYADGLADEALATVLDVAADTAPTTVVRAFADASMSDRQAAVRFLVSQLGTTFGPLRANLVESACRIAVTLDVDHASEVARFAASTILNEGRSRWRREATAGALWLGLLDLQIPDPLAMLELTDELEDVADTSFLVTLVPLLPHLGERAHALFGYLGSAYDTRPELMHEALATLSGSSITALWKAEGATIRRWYSTIPAATSPTRSPSAARTNPVVSAVAHDEDWTRAAERRYAGLLSALCNRQGADVSAVIAGVAGISLSNEELPSLYGVLWEMREQVFAALIDPRHRTSLAVSVIAQIAELDVEDLVEWCNLLEPEAGRNWPQAKTAATRVATQLMKDAAAQGPLARILARCVPLLSEACAEDVAEIFFKALIATPPDGGPVSRSVRARARAGLGVLDAHFPDRFAAGYLLGSHKQILDAGAASAAGADDFMDELQLLPVAMASHLDEKIATASHPSNDAAALLRLRIAARARGNLRPLVAKDVMVTLPPGSQATVLREWLRTSPPLTEVLKLLRGKVLPPIEALREYARRRNISDRSKMWITLERSTANDAFLQAVGRLGVNESVVAHMRPRIAGATLAEQRAATKRLVTADLSTTTQTKDAANTLAINLLSSGLAGAGPNAARITIAAGGAASGRKPELRKAFDAYVADSRQQIGSADLRALDDLGLLTPRKKSPIAALLDWL